MNVWVIVSMGNIVAHPTEFFGCGQWAKPEAALGFFVIFVVNTLVFRLKNGIVRSKIRSYHNRNVHP
jgi:hypothetical protein